MDEEFLGKIDGPLICLTAAILCHSLRCWRTGDFIDNMPFTRANCGGKIYSTNSRRATGRLTRKQGFWNVRYGLGMV
jgi:hypothetical protein